jgi:hypothetical protein
MTVRRKFWILSIANWLLAVVVWAISAYLGIARPASLFLYTTLFVIGIFAVLAGILCWVVARFGQEPQRDPAAATDAATETAETAKPGASVSEGAPIGAPVPAGGDAAMASVAAASDAGAEAEPSPDEPLPVEAG